LILAGPLPISTILLRRLRFRVIDPGFRVNLSESLSEKSVAVRPNGSQVVDNELVALIEQPDGGWAGQSADGAFFFVFMGICALVG
jgi:hypothetical protein